MPLVPAADPGTRGRLRGPRSGRLRRALPGLLVPAAYALARLLGPAGGEGAFVAGVAALLVGAGLLAHRGGGLAEGGLGALGVGLLLGLCALLDLRDPARAAGAAALGLSAALAAHGLARLGTALGAGPAGAGTAALLVLAASLTGLTWADPLAERAPPPRRWALRQAVLHADLATAYAYGAAGFDRLLHGPVYSGVPLASSSYERPGAWGTAGAWGALGLLAALAGAACARRRGEARRPEPKSPPGGAPVPSAP